MVADRPVIEILDVWITEEAYGAVYIEGNLESPSVASHYDTYSLEIEGWILGATMRIVALELYADGVFIRGIPVDEARPDVAAAYPTFTYAERSGFATAMGVLALEERFQLMLYARLEDGSLESVWTIIGTRRPIEPEASGGLTPIMVTTLGRTGSSHLVRLLGEHPEILVYRPFEAETRFSLYNLSILRATYDETSYGPAITFADVSRPDWWLGQERTLSQIRIPDPALARWLGRQRVDQMIAFHRQQVQDLYGVVASIQGKLRPRYFAEKYVPDLLPLIASSLYPAAKEIFLVRDFRDMFCSILAFHRKREYASFGRDTGDSDLDYLRRLGHSAVVLRDGWRARTGKSHLVRYEDLIEQPRETLRGVARYLDVDGSDESLDGIIARSQTDLPDQADHRTIDDPRRTIGRWRRDLIPSLQQACQETFSEILVEFGYELDPSIP